MALEDIFRALEEQADSDVEATLAEARAHAAAILEEAKREADASREARVTEAERLAVVRSAQDLNQARLEARKKVAAVKDRAINEVFDNARAALVEVRNRPDYDKVFTALAEEALAGVSGDFEVLVDEADVGRAEAFLVAKGLSAPVKADLKSAGGLVVVTKNGSVSRRNTLEDRLDKLRGLAQAEVAEIVFA